MGKWDDTGIMSKNTQRSSEKAPHMKGKINISEETLERLNDMMSRKEDIVLYFAGWRNENDANMLNLKVDIPRENKGGGGQRSRGSFRRDDPPQRGRSGGRYSDDDFPGDRGSRRDNQNDSGQRRNRYDEPDDEMPW